MGSRHGGNSERGTMRPPLLRSAGDRVTVPAVKTCVLSETIRVRDIECALVAVSKGPG
jgi:hypothetical protein